MNDGMSARLGLPLLQVGQAQKEMTHNEALTVLDVAVQPVVEAIGLNVPPPTPVVGGCWVVGPAPTGAWSGQAQALAGWTQGGWRFIAAREGLAAWSRADDALARYAAGSWTVGRLSGTRVVLAGHQVVGARQAAITTPSGGATVDVQARAALAAMLEALRAHGLIAL